MKDITVLRELRALTKTCYSVKAKVTVVAEEQKAMAKSIEALQNSQTGKDGSLKMWHVAVLTAVYSLASNVPIKDFLDLVR